MVTFAVRVLLICQLIAAVRVIARLARSAKGQRIATVPTSPAEAAGTVAVIVPVLDEVRRLAPCLDGLTSQDGSVGEILVVDGGSTDGTPDLVTRYAAQDPRIRLVDAAPVPESWNGKAWGLQAGWEARRPGTRWILTVDADVRPEPALVASLLAHAKATGLDAFSVATPQRLSGAAETVVHPALLATLVYRYGIPGSVATEPDDVQANGQCFLASVTALQRIGGFGSGRGAISEDVTIARTLVATGVPVGFFEPAVGVELVDVEMYDGWRDAWTNWTRSLPMRDHRSGARWWLRMADMTLTMVVPPLALLALALAGRSRSRTRDVQVLARLNLGLVVMRLGVAAGLRRAYRDTPVTYWLAPLLDPFASLKLWQTAVRRRHQWRGRPIERATTSTTHPTYRDKGPSA